MPEVLVPPRPAAERAAARPAVFDAEAVIDRLENDPRNLEFDGRGFVEKDVSAESSEAAAEIIFRFKAHLATLPDPKPARVFGSDCIYRCWPDEPRMFRKPDVSLVRADRLPTPLPRVLTVAPDLVVEVLSPNDVADDVTRKVELYHRADVPAVWVVNLPNRSVDVHAADGSVTRYRTGEPIEVGDALPRFACDVGELFPTAGRN